MQLLGPDGKPLVFGGGGDEGGVKSKPAKECNELMGTGDYSYLDVRLPDEVAQGAPGDKEWSCVNFAAFQRSEMGVEPDKEGFLKKVASYFPDKSVKLIVGCAGAPTSMPSSEVRSPSKHRPPFARTIMSPPTHPAACPLLFTPCLRCCLTW